MDNQLIKKAEVLAGVFDFHDREPRAAQMLIDLIREQINSSLHLYNLSRIKAGDMAVANVEGAKALRAECDALRAQVSGYENLIKGKDQDALKLSRRIRQLEETAAIDLRHGMSWMNHAKRLGHHIHLIAAGGGTAIEDALAEVKRGPDGERPSPPTTYDHDRADCVPDECDMPEHLPGGEQPITCVDHQCILPNPHHTSEPQCIYHSMVDVVGREPPKSLEEENGS